MHHVEITEIKCFLWRFLEVKFNKNAPYGDNWKSSASYGDFWK
jgi:hypothetical protein